jgi:hypothetical protein
VNAPLAAPCPAFEAAESVPAVSFLQLIDADIASVKTNNLIAALEMTRFIWTPSHE